ncbi:MAG: c-type cytochrome [Methylotetracoccus sp.]|nr:c-type cytochrome [Methylotetracoccus sp.]
MLLPPRCAVRRMGWAWPAWGGVLLLLAGCAGTQPGEGQAPVAQRAPDYARGSRLYQLYCGACHDAGQHDAPTLDDIEAWDERAFRWDSVLRQHAAQGFLNMPAQGGQPELSEQNMNDVFFFMLTRIRALDE